MLWSLAKYFDIDFDIKFSFLQCRPWNKLNNMQSSGLNFHFGDWKNIDWCNYAEDSNFSRKSILFFWTHQENIGGNPYLMMLPVDLQGPAKKGIKARNWICQMNEPLMRKLR